MQHDELQILTMIYTFGISHSNSQTSIIQRKFESIFLLYTILSPDLFVKKPRTMKGDTEIQEGH